MNTEEPTHHRLKTRILHTKNSIHLNLLKVGNKKTIFANRKLRTHCKYTKLVKSTTTPKNASRSHRLNIHTFGRF